MGHCSRCTKLRENWLKTMDKYTVDGRVQVETIEAHEREETAYQANMDIHRTYTHCSRIDLDWPRSV
jgi:hypothetical protein